MTEDEKIVQELVGWMVDSTAASVPWPRPVTRAVSARRQAERERVMKDIRERTARSADNGLEGSRDNTAS